MSYEQGYQDWQQSVVDGVEKDAEITRLKAEIAALRAKVERLERVVEAAYLEGYGQGTVDEPGYDEARFYKVRVQRAWEKSKAKLALDAGKEEGA